MKKINLNVIRIDGGTQPRERIDMEVVGDYAEAVKVGIEFPPVIVFHDGAEYWLADGFHRYHAHKQAGKASIEAEVRTGTCRDAKLFSAGANGRHGLPRSAEDKRRCVAMLLDDPEWAKWSQERIAKQCDVSAGFVSKMVSERRASLHGEEIRPAVRTVERAGKTFQQDTTKIGKAKPAATTVATPRETPISKPAKVSKREIQAPAPSDKDEQLSEAHHTVTELAAENEELRDKLAVESLMDSEEAKTQTAETIRELRALVKTLQAENAALKVSRDTYQRENGEMKTQIRYWRTQAEKAGKAAKDAA